MNLTKEDYKLIAKGIVDDNITIPGYVLKDKVAMASLQPEIDAYKESIGNDPAENIEELNKGKPEEKTKPKKTLYDQFLEGGSKIFEND